MSFYENKNEKQIIFNTKLVEESIQKINDGIILKRYENPWLKNEVGIRRSGIIFSMTEEEQAEYVKCALDPHYFAEKYCRIKIEDGTIGSIELRDYQKDILTKFVKNQFNILMCSRQTGKTIVAAIFILHTILFNNDKNVMVVANVFDTAVEIVDKIKNIYSLLPFFLKPGVKVWNQKSINLENGCRIKTSARTKKPAIGFNIDLLYLDEFAHIPSTIIEPYYKAVYPTVSAIENSKIIITSTPDGFNLFHRLLIDAEKPDGDVSKNKFVATRVYWYQVPDRFVTYVKLNDHLLYDQGIDKDYVLEVLKKKYSDVTTIKRKFISDLEKEVICVYNNEKCSDIDVKKTTIINSKGNEISILSVAEVSTWKEETIKNIGGEDAFNQEYGIRFTTKSKSLIDESIIEDLIKNKKIYEWIPIGVMEDKLRFSYSDLKWVKDENIFDISMIKDYKFILSIDISEGLGEDYSVINIFRICEKPKEVIELNKLSCNSIVDFFKLEQVGIYRSNIISIKQLAEIFYLLVFEYLNPDNCKVVLEFNTYGNTFLAELPYVFEGNNQYGSNVFFRYKHKSDSNEEKIGLRLGDNKSLLVKDYQDFIQNKSINLTNEDTVNEITTFVKHTTASGNIRYAADNGNDDCVMTVVDITSVFSKNEFKEMINECFNDHSSKEFIDYVNDILNCKEFTETVDYSQLLNIRKRVLTENRGRYSQIKESEKNLKYYDKYNKFR